MQFFIKEWDDQTASVMTAQGHILGYYPSMFEALAACETLQQTHQDSEICFHCRDIDNSQDLDAA